MSASKLKKQKGYFSTSFTEEFLCVGFVILLICGFYYCFTKVSDFDASVKDVQNFEQIIQNKEYSLPKMSLQEISIHKDAKNIKAVVNLQAINKLNAKTYGAQENFSENVALIGLNENSFKAEYKDISTNQCNKTMFAIYNSETIKKNISQIKIGDTIIQKENLIDNFEVVNLFRKLTYADSKPPVKSFDYSLEKIANACDKSNTIELIFQN